jgi:hypothetical protein
MTTETANYLVDGLTCLLDIGTIYRITLLVRAPKR